MNLRNLLVPSLLLLISYHAQSQSMVAIQPTSGKKGDAFALSISGTGTNWQTSTYYAYINVLFSGTGVYASNEYIIDPLNASGDLTIDNNAPSGPRDVTVIYTDSLQNQSTWNLPGGFVVRASRLLDVMPDSGLKAATFPVTITGECTNWQYSNYVQVLFNSNDVQAGNLNLIDTSRLTVDVSIDNNAFSGLRDVYVRYDDGSGARTDSLVKRLKVLRSVLHTIIPDSVTQGESLSVDIDGMYTNWLTGPGTNIAVQVSGSGVSLTNVNISNPNSISATVEADSTAQTGVRTLYVQYDDGSGLVRVDTLTDGLYVKQMEDTGPNSIGSIEGSQAFRIYPNPFKDDCLLTYDLSGNSKVTIELYNILGERIKTLIDTRQPSGPQQLRINNGSVDQGIYLVRLQVNDRSYSKILINLD